MKALRSCFANRLTDFIALRRKLGCQFREQARLLAQFDGFVACSGHQGPPTAALAVDFATADPGLAGSGQARRFQVVRQFYDYLATFEPTTPTLDPHELHWPKTRHVAHIYTAAKLGRLLQEARGISERNPIRGITLQAIVGLTASTGLRIGEVVRLDRPDVNLEAGILTIRRTKFSKDRLVPVHPTTLVELRRYAATRDARHSQSSDPAFFLNLYGRRFARVPIEGSFSELTRRAGLRQARAVGQRFHDLRHTFAVRRLVAYRHALRLLLLFASERVGRPPSRLAVEDLNSDIVLAFLDHLEGGRGNCIRTRNARLAAIRSFFHHVACNDPARMGFAQRILSIPGKRTCHRVVSSLSREELDAALAAPDLGTVEGRRDRVLLLFLARTGARVSEAVAVNHADVRLETPTQVLLHGKGSKDRVVPLAPDLVAVLRALREERRIPAAASLPVFLNARGRRLTRFGVIHILRRAVAKAAQALPRLGERSVSPHILRHTTAMHLLQAGVDLTTIQSWLGHASVATTHHYVEADVEMKRRALAQCGFPEVKPARFQPTDEVLALLDSL